MKSSFIQEAYKRSAPQSILDEVANTVLGYAMTSAFLVRNQGVEVSPRHFFTLLEYLNRGKSSIDFNSPETATGTVDNISLRVNISSEAKRFILTKLTNEQSEDFTMVNHILKYVNASVMFNALVSQITNNGVINRIIIDVDNISVDKPRDTVVFIDNAKVNVFHSFFPIYEKPTNIGGIGSKELDKDFGYQTQRNFINSSLGVDIGEDSAVYYQTANNNGSPSVATVEQATRTLYEEVCTKINQRLAGTLDFTLSNFRENLIQSIIKSCYGVDMTYEGDCLVIPTNGTSIVDFNIQKLLITLHDADLEAKCPEKLNPSIRIMDGKTELFKLRFKKEAYPKNVTGHRYKLYFTPSKLKEYFK